MQVRALLEQNKAREEHEARHAHLVQRQAAAQAVALQQAQAAALQHAHAAAARCTRPQAPQAPRGKRAVAQPPVHAAATVAAAAAPTASEQAAIAGKASRLFQMQQQTFNELNQLTDGSAPAQPAQAALSAAQQAAQLAFSQQQQASGKKSTEFASAQAAFHTDGQAGLEAGLQRQPVPTSAQAPRAPPRTQYGAQAHALRAQAFARSQAGPRPNAHLQGQTQAAASLHRAQQAELESLANAQMRSASLSQVQTQAATGAPSEQLSAVEQRSRVQLQAGFHAHSLAHARGQAQMDAALARSQQGARHHLAVSPFDALGGAAGDRAGVGPNTTQLNGPEFAPSNAQVNGDSVLYLEQLERQHQARASQHAQTLFSTRQQQPEDGLMRGAGYLPTENALLTPTPSFNPSHPFFVDDGSLQARAQALGSIPAQEQALARAHAQAIARGEARTQVRAQTQVQLQAQAQLRARAHAMASGPSQLRPREQRMDDPPLAQSRAQAHAHALLHPRRQVDQVSHMPVPRHGQTRLPVQGKYPADNIDDVLSRHATAFAPDLRTTLPLAGFGDAEGVEVPGTSGLHSQARAQEQRLLSMQFPNVAGQQPPQVMRPDDRIKHEDANMGQQQMSRNQHFAQAHYLGQTVPDQKWQQQQQLVPHDQPVPHDQMAAWDLFRNGTAGALAANEDSRLRGGTPTPEGLHLSSNATEGNIGSHLTGRTLGGRSQFEGRGVLGVAGGAKAGELPMAWSDHDMLHYQTQMLASGMMRNRSDVPSGWTVAGNSGEKPPMTKSASVSVHTSGLHGPSAAPSPCATAVSGAPSDSNYSAGTPTFVTSLPSDDTTSQVSSVLSPVNKRGGKKNKKVESSRRPRTSPVSSLSPPLSPNAIAARAAAGVSPTGVNDVKDVAVTAVAGRTSPTAKPAAGLDSRQRAEMALRSTGRGEFSGMEVSAKVQAKARNPSVSVNVRGGRPPKAKPFGTMGAFVTAGQDGEGLTQARSLQELQLLEMSRFAEVGEDADARVDGLRGTKRTPGGLTIPSTPGEVGWASPADSLVKPRSAPAQVPGASSPAMGIHNQPPQPGVLSEGTPLDIPGSASAPKRRRSAGGRAAKSGKAPAARKTKLGKGRKAVDSDGATAPRVGDGGEAMEIVGNAATNASAPGMNGKDNSCAQDAENFKDQVAQQVSQQVAAQQAVLADAETEARLRAAPSTADGQFSKGLAPNSFMNYGLSSDKVDLPVWSGVNSAVFHAGYAWQPELQRSGPGPGGASKMALGMQPQGCGKSGHEHGGVPDESPKAGNAGPGADGVRGYVDMAKCAADGSAGMGVALLDSAAKDPWSDLGMEMDAGCVVGLHDGAQAGDGLCLDADGGPQQERGVVRRDGDGAGGVTVDDMLEFGDMPADLRVSDIDWR